jgi:hypothetical protein
MEAWSEGRRVLIDTRSAQLTHIPVVDDTTLIESSLGVALLHEVLDEVFLCAAAISCRPGKIVLRTRSSHGGERMASPRLERCPDARRSVLCEVRTGT